MTSYLIGTIDEGLRRDVKPWATPENSFETLINAYQFRGRILKRSGYTLLGKLANGTPVMGLRTQENFALGQQTLIAFDTTTAYKWNGSAFVTLPSIMPVVWSGDDWQFFWTVNYANAFWATNGKSGLNGFAVTAFAGAAGAGPWTVQVTSAGNNFQVGDQIYFINLTGTAAANNLRSGVVTIAGNPFTISATTGGAFTNGPVLTGMALSTTRQTTGQDGIRYYGTLSNGIGWANYNPPVDAFTALAGALLIFPYRGYLVFLNTTEGNDQGTFNYGNRARWTQIGTPYYSEPAPVFPNVQGVDPKAARDDIFGRGGANDAPTNEVIVGAGFIRDILVVKFERSTWRLRFVNNAQNPFVWERVNIELGSSCTFSEIAFDKGLMGISNRGANVSDGNDTSRFDEKIPEEIFNIRQTEHGLQRVYGIRTFKSRLIYWAFPSTENSLGIYPDKVLVFNYESKTWSFFDDCFTCFGYYYLSDSQGYTWGDLPDRWSSYTNVTWDSGISSEGYENIVAGNQQGYVFILEQTDGQNSVSLSISAINNGIPGDTAIFTSAKNNLKTGDWISLTGVTGTTSSDGVSLNGRNFKFFPSNANDFTLTEFKPVFGGQASGATYLFQVSYKNIIAGSFQINIGTEVYKDTDSDGVLFNSVGLPSGTVSYSTGTIVLNFSPPIAATDVWIRLVTLDPNQGFDQPVETTGVYGGGGEIIKISGLDIQSKILNFLKDDQRARFSRIDFYTDRTTNGQFTCNLFADSSNVPVNKPLSDNPESNIVLTSANQYQVGDGDESLYRLYCDAVAQTLQIQITYSDYQLAVNAISQTDLEILAMVISIRKGGRLI